MCWKYVPIFILYATASCFNIDTKFPIVFVDPAKQKNKNAETYFGYSIVMNPRTGTNPMEWIRIGAPKGNYDIVGNNATNDGLVYNCKMSGCEPISFPKFEKTVLPQDLRYQISEIIHDGWVGGTMDISHKLDRMVVCGFHRYYHYYKKSVEDYGTMGTCYLSTLNTTDFENISPILDFRKYFIWLRGNRQPIYLYGQAQLGFSAHFSEQSGNSIDMVLGAPGVFIGAGTPINVKYEPFIVPPANRRRRGLLDDEFQRRVTIPSTKYNTPDELFGYSVTSGCFYQDGELLYAASAPKGNLYMGKVAIFEFKGDGDTIMNKEVIEGKQFGEYFGASITAGRINNDNLDDLVVAAPYFKDKKTYNAGRVYIFLSERGKLNLLVVLTGKTENSQFGTAIMCLGDIDSDEYGDIAVGAPYEDNNRGAVYIYGGSDKGVDPNPRQIIFGREITPLIRGFGIIISKPIDIDDNHYKDLAIGAHLSGNAVLLRSRPIVVIRQDLHAVPSMLKFGLTSISLDVCFSYSICIEDVIDVTYNMTIEGLGNIDNQKNLTKNISIFKENQTCDSFNVTLEDPDHLNSSIKVAFSYVLNYNYSTSGGVTKISTTVLENNDALCIRCPVLDEHRSSKINSELVIPFTRDCGDDDVCHSNLTVKTEIRGLRQNESFVLGSKNNLEVEITLENEGEDAYATELQIILPEVTFRQKPTRCRDISTNDSAISCTIDDPLRKHASRRLDFDLNLNRNLFKLASAKQLQILYRLVTTSKNSNNSYSFGLKLKKEADIELFGISEQQSNFFGNSTTGTSEVTHTYKIQKTGVSPLENITVEIKVPHLYITWQKAIAFLELNETVTLLGDQSITCKSELTSKKGYGRGDNILTRRKRDVKIDKDDIILTPNKTLYLNCSSETVKCSSIICQFDLLEETLATIKIRMLFNLWALSDNENNDIISFSTHAMVKDISLSETEKIGNRSDIVSTAFINDVIKNKKVDLWIIIVSAIVGILLLALLIFVLIKVQFFKRAKREELKNKKALVAAAQEENAAIAMAGEEFQEEELTEPFESSREDLIDQ